MRPETAEESETLAGLRRAVVADPTLDGPRLLYADALEEDGRVDHALAIRFQVLAAMTPRACDYGNVRFASALPCGTCEHCLCVRAFEHLTKSIDWVRETGLPAFSYLHDNVAWGRELAQAWNGHYGIEGVPYTPNPHLLIRRGFVEQAVMATQFWLQHGSELLARQPLQRAVVWGGRVGLLRSKRRGTARDYWLTSSPRTRLTLPAAESQYWLGSNRRLWRERVAAALVRQIAEKMSGQPDLVYCPSWRSR